MNLPATLRDDAISRANEARYKTLKDIRYHVLDEASRAWA